MLEEGPYQSRATTDLHPLLGYARLKRLVSPFRSGRRAVPVRFA